VTKLEASEASHTANPLILSGIAILFIGILVRIPASICSLVPSVNYHQFILGSNNVLFFSIAKITLISLWAVGSTAIL
jgi:hypothetical protein